MLHLWYQIAAPLWYRFFNMFTTIISNPARAALLTTYKPDSYSLSMPFAPTSHYKRADDLFGLDEKKRSPSQSRVKF